MRLLAFLFLMLTLSNAHSQEENQEESQSYDRVIVERYDGIPTGAAIHKIIVDRANNKIICSSKGAYQVNRFDQKASKLMDGHIVDACQDKTGNIWLAEASGKVQNLTTGINVVFFQDDLQVTCMEWVSGQLWVGTNKGVHTIQPSVGKHMEIKTVKNTKMKSDHIRFIHTDKYKNTWVGTTQGVLRIRNKNWNAKLEEKKMDFWVVKENSEALWMITDKEFWFIYDEHERWNPLGLEGDWYSGKINDFSFDTKGRLYMASNVLRRIDPYTGVIDTYGEGVGLISKKCVSLAGDKNSHMWIGTESAGLFRLRFTDNEADLLVATCILENGIRCKDDRSASILVNVSGGTSPYKYKWSERRFRGKNPKSLGPGNYSVSVTDANDIEYVASIEIVEPDKLQVDIINTTRITGRRKKDGSAEVLATGGTEPYKYKWSNESNSATLSSVGAGKYGITVSDKQGCKEVSFVEINREKILPELDLTKIKVGQTLRINELYFEADSSIVNEDSYEVLDEIYEFLSSHHNVVIEIGGHTNTIPSHDYCDKLSSERARNVATYLLERGIPNKRISFKGYGKRNPITESKSLKGRQKNQRVELKVLSVDG